jgi:hypothetical protein
MRRAATLILIAAVAVVAATLAGCGFAEFTPDSAPDVGALARQAGAVVLEQGSAENRYAGGTSAEWFAMGRAGSDEVKAVVFVLRFESQTDRNEAYRQIMYRMGRGLPAAVVYTVGDAVIQVSRIRDYGTVQDLNGALQDAGAL